MNNKIEIDFVLVDQLKALEESLWRDETRYSIPFQESVFADDCFEFGRSGRIYQRDDMIRSSGYKIIAKLPLQNFKVISIDQNTVLVTYVSEAQFENLERANRSSLWTKSNNRWQLRFHQGTPVES